MLDKLLRRTPALAPDAQTAIARLGKLAEKRPELRELAAINAALLQVIGGRTLPPLELAIDTTHGATKLEAGLPLLRGEVVRLDERALRDRFGHLCDAMTEQDNNAAAALAQAARRDMLPIAAIALATLGGDAQAMALRASDLGLDAGLAATLLRFTLFPVLRPWMEQQQGRFDLERWRCGFCWCCGAWALLGEYRGLQQNRFLRCGLCASEWELDRSICSFCDNRVYQDLISLAVEGEETHQRALACARCHTYVKQIATLVAIPPLELVASDLETLHLDLIAAERQYMAAY